MWYLRFFIFDASLFALRYMAAEILFFTLNTKHFQLYIVILMYPFTTTETVCYCSTATNGRGVLQVTFDWWPWSIKGSS